MHTPLTILALLFTSLTLHAADYYLSHFGNDKQSGLSPTTAWKTLERASTHHFQPGDRLLLTSKHTFKGQLTLFDLHGTGESPIEITSTNPHFPATIDNTHAQAAIRIAESSHLKIHHLAITADPVDDNPTTQSHRYGILIQPRDPSPTGQAQADTHHIELCHLHIHHLYATPQGHAKDPKDALTANGKLPYGWGIRLRNSSHDTTLHHIHIHHNTLHHLSHTGIKATGSSAFSKEGKSPTIHDLHVHHNDIQHTGGPGMQFGSVQHAHIHHNTVDHSGSKSDPRHWKRGSGLWTWGAEDIMIEHNRFSNASGVGDSAGAHIDFNCQRVTIQYNLSYNNSGGFIEILGNNHHSIYRYNISIHDGQRVIGKDGAFQAGKILWLSGYAGKEPRNGPYNTYIYNNTIVTTPEQVANFAIDRNAQGALIANNLFYIQGDTAMVKGDQYRPETDGEWTAKHIDISHNLYLRANTLPTALPEQDQHPIIGDPQFHDLPSILKTLEDLTAHTKATKATEHYHHLTPTNTELTQHTGRQITPLPGDDAMPVPLTHDILGQPIPATPSIGAIEP